MRFDFWNNPLVVTAMRLKYRRGSPGVWAVLWILVLLGVGALIHYLSQKHGFRFPAAYLVAILGVQCAVSAVIAVISTSTSMNAEVINRTLDFQRIVTLSPRAILLGKMLGEPALSYFLAIATVPLAALCWGLGAASGSVIFWLYVNLITSSLMWAAIGLINTLTPPAQTTGRQKSGGGAGIAIFFAFVPQLIFHGRAVLDAPGAGDALQMLTPIGPLVHLWRDSAWNARVEFWGVSIPSLLLAPVVQLAVAAWVIAAMSRRLKNSLDPLATKKCGYLTAAALDLAIAGICYAKWREGYDGVKLLYGYCLGHIFVCMIMMFATVPRRQALVSWLWRRDDKARRLPELLTADRSEMSAAAVVYAAIGLAVLTLGLILPLALTPSPARVQIPPPRLAEVAAATTVIIVATSILHQMLVAAAARGGHLIFILLIVMANILPPITGAVLQASTLNVSEEFSEALASTSPVALFVMNMTRVASPYQNAAWTMALYGCIGLVSYALLRRVLSREAGKVQRKLQSMALAT